MSYEYMKGKSSRVKPLGQPVPMDERQYNIDLARRKEPRQPEAESLKASYKDGWNEGYTQGHADGTPDSDVLLQQDVLDLLESDDYSTKHGKTIAKALREEWGIE